MNKKPYTKNEKIISHHLVEAVNYFRKLVSTHSSHERDFIDGIHKCQNAIIHRIIQRDYPEDFPTYKKGNIK